MFSRWVLIVTVLTVGTSGHFVFGAEAHVHGHAELGLAGAAKQLELTLTIPSHDIVGFEHAPTNDKEKKILEAALEVFRVNALLEFKPACSMDSATATHKNKIVEPSESSSEKAAKPLDGNKDVKTAELAEANDEHFSIEVTQKYSCSGAVERTKSLKVVFVESMKNLKKLQVQFVLGKKRGQTDISYGKPTIF